MGIELDIGYGLANLKLNLGDFLAVAQQIAGVTKHREAREALKASIEEIRKSCDTAVEVFTPLYALTDEASFTKNFGNLHATFKNSYFKNIDAVRTHCTVVKIHLESLLKNKAWLGGLPILERSYTRLQGLCDRWLFQDYTLANEMDAFLKQIDTLYTELSNLAQSDPSTAFTVLRSCLQQYEDDFLSLRKQLNALDVLGRTL